MSLSMMLGRMRSETYLRTEADVDRPPLSSHSRALDGRVRPLTPRCQTAQLLSWCLTDTESSTTDRSRDSPALGLQHPPAAKKGLPPRGAHGCRELRPACVLVGAYPSLSRHSPCAPGATSFDAKPGAATAWWCAVPGRPSPLCRFLTQTPCSGRIRYRTSVLVA